MKKYTLIYLCSLFIFSCNQNPTKNAEVTLKQNSGFVLNGTIQNNNSNKVYLNKIIENSIYKIDSTTVLDNSFTFQGEVEYPERFAITFVNYSAIIVFVLENTTFKIVLNSEDFQNPKIVGSELNSKLNEYKISSKNIFKKIDYLFPHFQKARLENDVEKLEAIGNDLNKIEEEFTNYSFEFIKNNSDSYIGAMVLRDQLKTSKIDTLRIKNSFNLLSKKVKSSPDAQIIEAFLNSLEI